MEAKTKIRGTVADRLPSSPADVARFYEPAQDANWHQRNMDKIAAYNKAVREARAR